MAPCPVASRVGARFLRRLGAPAVTAMHNGSSYHALPALLSDLRGAQAALLGNSSDAGGRRGTNGAKACKAPCLPCISSLIVMLWPARCRTAKWCSASAVIVICVCNQQISVAPTIAPGESGNSSGIFADSEDQTQLRTSMTS